MNHESSLPMKTAHPAGRARRIGRLKRLPLVAALAAALGASGALQGAATPKAPRTVKPAQAGAPPAQPAPPVLTPVRIGILTQEGDVAARQKWQTTAEFLGKEIPGFVFEVVPANQEGIAAAVSNQSVQFILVSPSLYVQMEKRYGAAAIVALKGRVRGVVVKQHAGVIFARADRKDIRTLGDLRGKRFAAVDRTAFAGWLTAWRELKDAGIDPFRNLAAMQFAGGSQETVVGAVLDGRTDAGVVRADLLVQMISDGRVDPKAIRVLAPRPPTTEYPFAHSTRLYPEWTLAVMRGTPEDLAQRVTIALLSMPPDNLAALAANCAGWTVPLDYMPVHDCLRELRVSPYEDYGRLTLRLAIARYWRLGLTALVLLGTVVILGLSLKRKNRELAALDLKLAGAIDSRQKTETTLNETRAELETRLKESADELVRVRTGLERELSTLKATEQDLRSSEAAFRVVAEQCPAGLWVYAAHGLVFVNQAFADMFGYTCGQIIQDLRVRDLVEESDCAAVEESLRKCLQGEAPEAHARFGGVRKAGPAIELELLGARANWNGQPAVIGTLVDVSDFAREYDEMQQRLNESTQASELLGSVTSDLEMSRVLDRAIQGMLDLTALDAGVILLRDPSRDALGLAAATNVSSELIQKLSGLAITPDDCVCARVAETSEPWILSGPASETDAPLLECIRAEGFRFHAIFPLQSSGRTIGVLCLFSRGDSKAGKWTLDLARRLCGPIAQAIENARSFEVERLARTEQEKANRNSTSVLGGITEPLLALDTQQRCTYANAQAAELLGRTPESLAGNDPFSDLPPMAQKTMREACERVLATGQMFESKERFPEWNRWLETRCSRSGDGIVVRLRDVTSGTQAEEECARESRRLRRLLESADEGLVSVDLDGVCSFANAAAARMLGCAPEEMLGRRLDQFVKELQSDGGAYPEGESPLEAAIKHGRACRGGDTAFLRRDGPTVRVSGSWLPIVESGEPRGAVLTFSDVTAFREAEASVRKRQAALKGLFEATTDAIFVKDCQGRYVMLNSAAERVLGLPASDIIGKTDTDLLPAEIAAAIAENDRQALSSGEPRAFEESINVGGHRRLFHSVKSPLRDEKGAGTGLIVVARDITDRKRAEDELRRLNRLLRILGECGHQMGGAENEQALLDGVCRVIVGQGGYRRAWIGVAEKDAGKGVRPVARAGAQAEQIEALQITWADNKRGRGPTSTALRSSKPCVINDVVNDPRYAPWVDDARNAGYASVASLPLLHQNELLGALTVCAAEPNAFDPNETEFLARLANDLAAGIATARAKVQQRRGAEAFNDLAVGTAQITGERFFPTLVQRLAATLEVRCAIVAECLDEACSKARVLAFCKDGVLADSYDYRLENTPSQMVLQQRTLCSFPEKVQKQFPADTALAMLGADSFMGVPLLDSGGRPIGALFVVHDQRVKNEQQARMLLGLFAGRTAAELERQRVERSGVEAGEKLLALSRRLVRTHEADQRQLARQLHEGVGQKLNTLKSRLHHLLDFPEAASPDEQIERIEEDIDLVEELIEQTHAICVLARPPMLDDMGLVAALRALLEQQAKAAGCRSEFSAEESLPRLDSAIETACYRVAQVAIGNAVRHSQATVVAVHLGLGVDCLHLVIRDDGRGFDVAAARARSEEGASLGLLSMEERVVLVGGRVELQSTPGQGTEIHAWFPAKS